MGSFWLPPGSIRDLLAVLIVGSLCAGFFTGRIEAREFIGIAAMVLQGYGFARLLDKNGNGNGAPPGKG